MLVAVLVIGVEVAGQRNWIEIIGPFRLQPSEFAKLALVVWGASLLSQTEPPARHVALAAAAAAAGDGP